MRNHAPTQSLSNSTLYLEYLAEKAEILKHKWIESEKAGEDIGFARARLHWLRNHRDDWCACRRKRCS